MVAAEIAEIDSPASPSLMAAPPATMAAAAARRMPRLQVLDGWRGLSILLVLAAHLLPLGPKSWEINDAAGRMGMALFFTLSGFLIISTLIFHPSVRLFAIRRLTRIVPAAWLFMVIALVVTHANAAQWRGNLLFYSNLPPFPLIAGAGHMWSLCVEVQFYAAIAIGFLLLRERVFPLLPVACVAVTAWRVYTVTPVSIVTLQRVDEILAGATLAWLFHGVHSQKLRAVLRALPVWVPLFLLALACAPGLPWMNYARPYFAAAVVGATLFVNGTVWNRMLESKALAWLAGVSYAVYLWHGIAMDGWFAAGGAVVKYAKRPLGLLITFVIAWLSTTYYEAFWIRMGKRWTQPRNKTGDAAAKATVAA